MGYQFAGVGYWDPDSDDTTVRYTLGAHGKMPLVVIGINPSTAEPIEPDPTIRMVERLAATQRVAGQGFDGWLMLNVYPHRDALPANLPAVADAAWHRRNCELIAQTMATLPEAPVIVPAFGDSILKRAYLPPMFLTIRDAIAAVRPDAHWCFLHPEPARTPLLTAHHMPRHPFPGHYYDAEQAALVDAAPFWPTVLAALKNFAI